MPLVRQGWWQYALDPSGTGIAIQPSSVVKSVLIPSVITPVLAGSNITIGNPPGEGGAAIVLQTNIFIDGTLFIGGSDFLSPGVITADGSGLHLFASAGLVDTSGDLTVGGNLTVGANTHILGNLTVDGTVPAAPPPTVLGSPCTGVQLTLTGALAGLSVATADPDIKHGTATEEFAGSDFLPITNGGGSVISTAPGLALNGWTTVATTLDFYYRLPLKVGDRLQGLTVNVHGGTGATFAVTLQDVTQTTGAAVGVGSTATSALTATDQALTPVFTAFVAAAGHTYWVRARMSSSSAGLILRGGNFTADRP